MGVRSTVFGGVTLTGEDADKFIKQVRHGRVKPAAVTALAKGRKMTKEMDRKGYVTIKKKKAA